MTSRPTMHRRLAPARPWVLTLTLLAALPLVPAARAGAQVRDSVAAAHEEAREAARRAVEVFNAPATLRVNGSLVIDSSRTITGDVAVFGGTLTVAGHVTGRVVAINADVELRPGARVDGEVLVVGGRLAGRDDATVGGAVATYRQTVLVREDGEQLALADEPLVDRWWERWRTRHARSRSAIRISGGGTYNRVEGLPVHLGPVLRQRTPWGRVNAEVFGIYRSARDFRWDSENIGHDARLEVTTDGTRGVGIGAESFDVVAPVEGWKLTNGENGFASFFLHRDYRDHYGRHGGTAYVRAFGGESVDLRLGLSDERWADRRVRDPWTLFRDRDDWRENPFVDEGRFHLATATLRIDTRNDETHPWAGWYLNTELERGAGRVTRANTSSTRELAPGETDWTRGFLDVRRYNRLAPNTQLNVRLVLGGWLGGGPLPLQRRLSLGGPGTLEGYDFRRDALPQTTCTDPSALEAQPRFGTPAECERIALAQLEYRNDFSLDLDWFGRPGTRLRMRRAGQWMLFANSGRGWLVGPRQGEEQYGASDFPDFSTFRTDIGAGVDFGILGFYVAKSVSDGDENPNFLVRLRRRF
jgi:hypothetical protein